MNDPTQAPLDLPTAPIDGLAAEAALFAIGYEKVLEGKPTWNLVDKRLAANLPKVVRKYLYEFVSKTERREVEDLPDFDYEAVQKLVNKGATVKQATALSEAVDNFRLGTAISADVARITQVMQQLLPQGSRTTTTGDVPVKPAPDQIEEYARSWAVACKPLIVLVDLCEGSLSSDQVKALQNLYPNLYQLVTTVANEVIAKMKVKRGDDWELDDKRDRLLGLLLGKSDGSPDLGIAADFQAIYNAKPQQGQPPAINQNATFRTDFSTPGATGKNA